MLRKRLIVDRLSVRSKLIEIRKILHFVVIIHLILLFFLMMTFSTCSVTYNTSEIHFTNWSSSYYIELHGKQ